jgi:hypothetical protein
MEFVRNLNSDDPAQIGERFLTLAEAAEVLRLSPRTVGDSGRCRSVFRGMPITDSGMMAIMIPG